MAGKTPDLPTPDTLSFHPRPPGHDQGPGLWMLKGTGLGVKAVTITHSGLAL